MGTPLPSYGPPKLVESRGIKGFPPRTPQTLERRKPQNRAPFLTDLGRESKGKNHKGFMHTTPNKSPREKPRKLSKKIAKKRLRKLP
jgi:hypothetical protein